MQAVPAQNKVKQFVVNALSSGIRSRFTISITVTRYYTNVDGQILDKNDPAVPAALQVAFPVYMLGNFDRMGANRIGAKSVPTPLTAFFLTTFTWGFGAQQPFLTFTGLSEIKAKIFNGDIVTVYTDSLDAPTCFAWIVQSSQDGAPVASIIGNTESVQDDGRVGQMNVTGVNFFTDNENQLLQDWQIIHADNTGQFRSQTFQPNLYKTPEYAINRFVDLDLRFKLTQYFGINFYITFESSTLSLRFKIA